MWRRTFWAACIALLLPVVCAGAQSVTVDSIVYTIDQEAHAAIEPLRASDPERYAVYSDHITLESLFPRYALISLYSGNYSSTQLQQMRVSFKEDSTALGVTMVDEQTSFSSVFNTWGV